jgi:hypothetical protein
MPKTLRVGTDEFDIPLQGESPDYGEQLSDYFEAVAGALTQVQQPNDILRTTAAISNNQTTFTSITGFQFDTTEVRSINSDFLIKRTTVSPANNLVESGTVRGNFNGSSWSITIESEGNAGVEFNITDAGQLQYKSTSLVGSSYEGLILFRAKVFNE